MADENVPAKLDDNQQPHSAPAPDSNLVNELTTKALEFLSNASNETLIACAVGASAVLYMVFGRFGLLLIGVIVGVALHATWDRQNNSPSDADNEKKRRKEVGLDVARRLLDWTDARKTKNDDELDARTEVALKVASRKELDFSEYPPETASALAHLTDTVIRDYVKYWYGPMLPGEESFPVAARQTFTGFILAFCNHQARKRPADALLEFLTNATSIFIVFLSELSKALMAPDMHDLEASEALQLYLDRSPDNNLANMASPKEQEHKLLSSADDFLQSFLDPKTYNCEPARTFLKQVFAGVVLQSVLNSISQPEWINGWIVYLLEEGEPELISAIDAGVEGAANKVKDSMPAKTQPQQAVSGDGLTKLRTESEETGRQSVDDAARQKRLSMAGDAMQAAMDEAKRLTEMIQSQGNAALTVDDQASSAFTTETQVTPNSSDSEIAGPERIPEASNPTAAISEPTSPKQFTSFDQIAPAYRPVPEAKPIPPLTLHNARITIFDDAVPGDRSTMKSKPQTEYLLQIEPASQMHSGWMVPRKHSEVEPLHEYLYKIANVSGAPSFARKYPYLPTYKGKTKDAYRQDLEKYLHDALSYEPLAESEGMKRFLDKDQGFQKSGANKNPLAFAAPVGDAFQTVGKGMLGGLTTAGKGVTTGGQAVFDGIGGLFGGPKKAATSPKPPQRPDSLHSGRSFTETEGSRVSREYAPSPRVSFETRAQSNASSEAVGLEATNEMNASHSSLDAPPALPPRQIEEDGRKLKLPPPPSILSEDDEDSALPTPPASIRESVASLAPSEAPKGADLEQAKLDSPLSKTKAQKGGLADPYDVPSPSEDQVPNLENKPSPKKHSPIDEQETRVAIELMFAAINELYTLSSAWNIRRTLLNAAKNYLLRPSNPSLLSIQELLQNTVLDANLSDKAIADQIRKMRANSMPTEAELATWPPPSTNEEKEKLRIKARKLLVTKGMPKALTSVMGTAASGEALGRVFDALQVERVSRAFMFAMLMQGLRTVIS